MNTRVLMLAAVLVFAGLARAETEPQYAVEMDLWLHGEAHGTPMVIVEADAPARIERLGESGSWRIEVEVQRPAAHEQAPGDALWLHVAGHEQEAGEWTLLADTILGVPEGQQASFSVVDGEVIDPGPEDSLVHLTATVSRMQPGAASRSSE